MTGALLAAINRLLTPPENDPGGEPPEPDWFGVAVVTLSLLCAAATVAAISRPHP